MQHRVRAALAAVLAAGVLSFGCGTQTPAATGPQQSADKGQPAQQAVTPAKPAATQAAAQPEKAKLNVGIIPISNLTPLYVADKLGYFKEQGLEVQTTVASGGPALTGGLIGGSLDFVYVNYVSIFQAVSEGFDLKIVAHQNSAQDAPPDAAPVIVRNDGKITKVSDLAGKRIAINALNNINRIATQYLLEKHGVSAASVKFIEMPFPNMGDALAKDQIDAAVEVEPFVTVFLKEGKIKQLAYPFLEMAGGLDIAGFVASGKFVQANPVTVERFVAALAKANNYLNGNKEELIKYTAEFTKSEPALIRELTLDRWADKVDVKDLQMLSDYSLKYGLQKQAVKVDPLIHKTALK